MSRPNRRDIVDQSTPSVYHCMSKTVRSYCDMSDTVKSWIKERLQWLSRHFAIETLSFAVLDNHLHTVNGIRPDLAEAWTVGEVARRWLKLCPPKRFRSKKEDYEPADEDLYKLLQEKDVEDLRRRLSSLSWFNKFLKEHIAQQYNRHIAPENERGVFWNGRFKCKRLETEADILRCCQYVDLNLIRAGLADKIEGNDNCSAYFRCLELMNCNKIEREGSWSGGQSKAANNKQSGLSSVSLQSFGDSSFFLPSINEADYVFLLDELSRVEIPGKAFVVASLPKLTLVLKNRGYEKWRDYHSLFSKIRKRSSIPKQSTPRYSKQE